MKKTWTIIGWLVSWCVLSLIWMGLVYLCFVLRDYYLGWASYYHIGSLLSYIILPLASYTGLFVGPAILGILMILTYRRSRQALWIIWVGAITAIILILLWGGAALLSKHL